MDIKACKQKGVAVFNAPYSNTRSVAELVIGASIMLIRKIVDKNKAAHEGIWNKEAKGSFELRGKTMGLIGYGNIGTQTSIMAEAMGMKVKFFDTDAKLPLGNAQAVKSLKELVSTSDIISIHVPETNQTKNLIENIRKNINSENIEELTANVEELKIAMKEMVDTNSTAQ